MKKIKILIPKIRPPEISDYATTQIREIILALKNEYDVEEHWLIFQPDKVKTIHQENFHQINYQDYEDATDILKQINPDIVLVEGILGINGISFSLACKFLQIPIVSLFTTLGNFGSEKKWSRLFSNLRFLSLNKFGGDVKKEKKSFIVLRYSLLRYKFLLNTLTKINYNFFQKFKFILFYPRIQIFSRTKHTIHKIMDCDMNFCPTKSWSNKLISLGFNPSGILIVGNPSFDPFFNKLSKNTNSEISEKLEFLICTSPMHEHGHWTSKSEFLLIEKILRILNKIPNSKISIKIHPSTSDANEYQIFLKQFPFTVNLYQKENLTELMSKSSIVITYGDSTVSIFGVLLKKHMIHVNLASLPSWNLYFDSNLMLECKKIDHLPKLIEKSFLVKPNLKFYENYVEKNLGIFDGKCSTRIGKKIQELIEKNKLI